MSSYSEWLGRKLQNEKKYLDTRPHRDAGHHTEVVKRLAVATLAERPTGKPVVEASTYTDYVGGVGLRTGTAANTKAPQITQVCASVNGVDNRYPSPAYTNRAVLAGLGKAKLANCCVTCGVVLSADRCGCIDRNSLL